MRDAVRVTSIGAKALRMRAHETSLRRQKKTEPDDNRRRRTTKKNGGRSSSSPLHPK
jgi:hypothetical protein